MKRAFQLRAASKTEVFYSRVTSLSTSFFEGIGKELGGALQGRIKRKILNTSNIRKKDELRELGGKNLLMRKVFNL